MEDRPAWTRTPPQPKGAGQSPPPFFALLFFVSASQPAIQRPRPPPPVSRQPASQVATSPLGTKIGSPKPWFSQKPHHRLMGRHGRSTGVDQNTATAQRGRPEPSTLFCSFVFLCCCAGQPTPPPPPKKHSRRPDTTTGCHPAGHPAAACLPVNPAAAWSLAGQPTPPRKTLSKLDTTTGCRVLLYNITSSSSSCPQRQSGGGGPCSTGTWDWLPGWHTPCGWTW